MKTDDDDILADRLDVHDPRLADNRPLAEMLGDANGPLEGPGVPFMLNPIRAADEDAWATWQAGAVDLWRPRHACSTYFEFEALHRRRFVAVIRKAGELRDLLVDDRGRPKDRALIRFIETAGGRMAEDLQALGPYHTRTALYRDALRDHDASLPANVPDAVAIMRTLEPVEFPPADFGPLLAELVALAHRL